MRGLMGCFGLVLTLCSVPFVIMAIDDIIAGQDVGVAAAMGFFFAGTAAAGGWVARRTLQNKPPPKQIAPAIKEQQILALAAGMGGRITVSEVALRSGLSIDESRVELDKMVNKGVAEIFVTDDGAQVYHFAGLLTESERGAAQDPMQS